MCGGVRFEITAEPESAGYCHCTRCQRRTGTAASAQARIAPGSFRLLAGDELIREYAPGDGWPKCFCAICGSALWSKYPETGEVGSVRIGLLVDRVLAGRCVEGRPAAPGVVLRLRLEQRRAAARAAVRARLEGVVVLAAERRLRSLLAEDVELLRRELRAPLLLGLLDLRHAASVPA